MKSERDLTGRNTSLIASQRAAALHLTISCEEVRAVIQLKAGYEPSDELKREILDYAARVVAKYKIPRAVDFVDDLPRSEAGKIQRNKVRAPYWEGRARAI